jgi:hypothetical protein
MATAVTAQDKPAADLNVISRKQRSLWGDAVYRLIRNRAALVGLVVIALAALVAIFASVLAPYDPLAQNGPKQLMEPIWTKFFGSKFTDPAYIFGSDELGRDILSRLIYSSRVSLIIGFVPVSIVLFIGISVGMLAGYVGGVVDDVLMRVTDVVYAFPDLLFVIIIVATLRGTGLGEAFDGLLIIFVGIAVVNWVSRSSRIRVGRSRGSPVAGASSAPPLTGGMKATSSPSARPVSGGVYSPLRAKRTEGRPGARTGCLSTTAAQDVSTVAPSGRSRLSSRVPASSRWSANSRIRTRTGNQPR